MIQTFDFLPVVWRSEELKNKLLTNVKEKNSDKIIIGVHTLFFDFEKKTVKVFCNDNDYLFHEKIVPVEILFDSFINMINGQFDNVNYKII